MGKKIRSVAILAASLLITGCKATVLYDAPSAPVLVTQVEVNYVHESGQLVRLYTQPEKMDTVLNYLYALRPHSKREDISENLTGDRCRIVLTLSDGQCHTYRLYGGCFFSDDGTTWHRVELKQPSALLFLLVQMDSDGKT